MHDPVIEGRMITIPEVAMSPDLRLATVYVMPLGGRDAKPVIAALERNKKYLRGEIAHRVNLKFAPDIRFRLDERFDEAERIEKILRTPEVQRDLEAKDGDEDRMSDDESQDGAAPAPRRITPRPPARPKKVQHRREKRDVHGWIILDKPVGMTSTHAVAIAKRLFTARRAGHAGTLDPLASGLLPLALGEATKTVPFVMDGRKRYRFTVRWGEERDTDDAEGRVVADLRRTGRPRRRSRPACRAFPGTIEQVPPKFSAIKIDGERAYDLARDGRGRSILEARPVDDARSGPGRAARRRYGGFRGRMRQGHLCAGACARYRAALLGCLGSRHGAPPHPGRPIRRKRHDFTGGTGGFVPESRRR